MNVGDLPHQTENVTAEVQKNQSANLFSRLCFRVVAAGQADISSTGSGTPTHQFHHAPGLGLQPNNAIDTDQGQAKDQICQFGEAKAM